MAASWHLPGFLKLLFQYVCLGVYVYVPYPYRLLITSIVMWGDMDPYDWLNKLAQQHLATWQLSGAKKTFIYS